MLDQTKVYHKLFICCFFFIFTEQCERTIVPECASLGFNETFFPNFFEEQSQSDANQSFVGFFKPKSGCHVDLLYFICSLQFPKCSKGHVYQPCRRTCNGNNVFDTIYLISCFMPKHMPAWYMEYNSFRLLFLKTNICNWNWYLGKNVMQYGGLSVFSCYFCNCFLFQILWHHVGI